MSRSFATLMLASAVVFGVIAGLALGRTWKSLFAVQVRWLPLLVGSLVIRSVAALAGDAGYPIYLVALAGTSVAAAANYTLTGALFVAIGGCLNLLVVGLNHGMPVDPSALAVAGAQMPHDALHIALDASTRLGLLADIIPFPVIRSVYSAGDLSIAIGGFLVPFTLLARR